MFLDPNKLLEVKPAEVLDAAAHGHLGLDRRFLHSLLDRREEALPALIEFANRDRNDDVVDLAPEIIALSRYWNAPESIPFFVEYIKEDPSDIPDEAVETLVALGEAALDPLLVLYQELEESDSGEVAFILANLGIHDERILKILLDRLEFDLSDTALLLGMYGDPAARPALEIAGADLTEKDAELKKEVANALETLDSTPSPDSGQESGEPFDIWAEYPEEADLPMELLDEDERTALLDHPIALVRAAAANSFFNRELNAEQRKKMLQIAQHDEAEPVRARSWEALMTATEEIKIVEAMLAAMRNPALPAEERAGLLVGLSAETDRNEVRKAILELYEMPGRRAKALEAMWRSMHASFRDYFAKHLDDSDIEVRRSAVWGVGYYGLRSELDHLRKLFTDEELRSDALFAYALAMPAEISRGRMKGLLARIEKEANGLSEMEEELIKAALDERLMLAGKEPVFSQEED